MPEHICHWNPLVVPEFPEEKFYDIAMTDCGLIMTPYDKNHYCMRCGGQVAFAPGLILQTDKCSTVEAWREIIRGRKELKDVLVRAGLINP